MSAAPNSKHKMGSRIFWYIFTLTANVYPRPTPKIRHPTNPTIINQLYLSAPPKVIIRQYNSIGTNIDDIAIGCLVLKYSSFVGLNMYRFVHILHILSENFVGCTGAGAPKAPLCKGSCQPNRLTEGLTTPPSKIKDFAHLPLHRGGFGTVQTC